MGAPSPCSVSEPEDFAGATVGRLDVRGAFGEPAAAGRRDFKFLVANSLSAEFDSELPLS